MEEAGVFDIVAYVLLPTAQANRLMSVSTSISISVSVSASASRSCTDMYCLTSRRWLPPAETVASLQLQGLVIVHFKRKPWEIKINGPAGISTEVVCPEVWTGFFVVLWSVVCLID
jgi:hypothetical protein